MNHKNKNLLKNIGLFTIGSFGSKILSFLLVPLYTAVLSTTDYGSVDLVTSTAQLLMPILLVSVFDAVLRFGMDTNYRKEDVLVSSLKIAVKGSVALIIALICIGVMPFFSIPNSYLFFLGLYFVLGSFNQIFTIYLKAKNRAKDIAISGIICTFITCILNIFLLLVLKWGILGYMISNIIGVIVQVIYQLVIGKIYKDIVLINHTDLSRPMLKYSAPLVMNTISWWVNNASDRYILAALRGVSINGIYAVSYKIPTILTMFQGIFYNAWSISAIAEFDKEDSDGFIGNNYSLYSFVSLFICSLILLFNIPIAHFLYKGDFFGAWKCVPFLLMGTVFCGISQFEGSLFAATKMTKTVSKTSIIGAVVNTVGNIIFIYFIGPVGAALSTLLGYFTTWVLRTIYMQDFVKMKVEWKKHFVSIMIVLIQSIMATLGVVIYIQFVPFIMLVLINRHFIVFSFRKYIDKDKA